jgi:Holliday junction resolvasome RuvABC endonuclease subunit
MIVAGIDYSITSPSIVISEVNGKWNHHKTKAFYFEHRKTYPLYPDCDIELCCLPYPVWTSLEERYNKLSEWAIAIIKRNMVDIVYLEGYALSRSSTSGLIFNIAECCGVLKHKMYMSNINFVSVTPTALKMWVTGKGQAKKEQMEEAFIADTGIDNLRQILSISDKVEKPIFDIIDAYFLCKYGYVDQTEGIFMVDTKPKKKPVKVAVRKTIKR